MGIYKITWIIFTEVYIQTATYTYGLTLLKIKNLQAQRNSCKILELLNYNSYVYGK
jgi:hypothetical protein